MEKDQGNFEGFLKEVVSQDSHPIYQALLTWKRIWKIYLIDSLLKGMMFGISMIVYEISIRSVYKSWKASGWYLLLLQSINLISACRG